MKSGQGKLSERLRNAPHLLADEQYLKWVIEQVEELENEVGAKRCESSVIAETVKFHQLRRPIMFYKD